MMGRRLTLHAWGTLTLPRRDLQALALRIFRGLRLTYDEVVSATVVVDVPDGAPVPQAHIALNHRGKPSVYIDRDDAQVVMRSIRSLA
jgi:hypothetical protein